MFSNVKSFYLLTILSFILAACQSSENPEPIVETQVQTEVVEAPPVEVIQVLTPTPEPAGLRTLVICMGAEPSSLYPFGELTNGSFMVSNAFAEGNWSAFDTNSYAYQPIILEKLPSLADGDAILTEVTVSQGDTVVAADGEVVILDTVADPPILLTPAGGGKPVPYQGGEFEMEQLSVTFSMLPNLLWSDGAPLTAADSVYAFNLLADPVTPRSDFTINRTLSYEAIDDLTTMWTGLPGYLDPTFYINFFGPAPEHLWGQYTAIELQSAEQSTLTPIGWGPYIIDEWVQGESLTLHKNPNYFRANEGLPKFDILVFRFVGENATANIAAILSGECDLVDESGDLVDQIEKVLELHEAGLLKATFTTGTLWEHVDFGIQHVEYDDGYQQGSDRPDFFSDIRTRQAFAMCMDRQALVDNIFFGQTIVIDNYLPPQHPLYNPEIRHYEFNVEAGSALLEEVGWVDDDGDAQTPRVAQNVPNVTDGTRLEVTYETMISVLRQNTAYILQASLAECGIRVDLQISHPKDFFTLAPEGNLLGRHFDLSEYAWGTSAKPPCDLYLSNLIPGPAGDEWTSIQDGITRRFSTSGWNDQNFPGFANEEYDRNCSTALSSLPGKAEYEAAHLEAQRIFNEQLPIVPLYLQIKLIASRPDMCGVIRDPTSAQFWNLEEFDYGEGCEE